MLAFALGHDNFSHRILMEGTSSGLRFFADCFWHFVAICGYALRCCSRQRQGQPVQAKPRKAKPKAAAKQSSVLVAFNYAFSQVSIIRFNYICKFFFGQFK